MNGNFNVFKSVTLSVTGNSDLIGTLSIGGTTTTQSQIVILDTTDSILSDTGALVVHGGACIDKHLLVGSLTCTGQASISSIVISSTLNSVSVSTGALVVNGGIGIAKDIVIGGALGVAGTTTLNNLVVSSTIESTGLGVGSIVADGGISASGNMFLGGMLSITNTTDATFVGNGALICAGGASVAKSVYIGGHVNIGSTATSSSTSTGALTVSGGIGVQGTTYTNDIFVEGSLHVNSTTDAISVGTGAFIVDGGASIAKSVYIGGDVVVESTLDSFGITSGAIVVSGGIGATGSVNIGGNISLQGHTSVLSFVNNGFDVPSTVVRSSGTRISLHDDLSLTGYTEFALGVSGTSLWYSTSSILTGHAWYSGTNQTMSLSGLGTLQVTGTVDCPNLNVTSTVNSTSSTNGAVVVGGGVGVAGNVCAGGDLTTHGKVTMFGATSGSVSIKSASTVAIPYTLTCPPALPSTTSYVTCDTSGQFAFMDILGGGGITYDGNTTSVVTNTLKRWVFSTTVYGGYAIGHPTSDGTVHGAALFTSIRFCTAMATSASGIPYQVAICGLYSISVDLKSVTFVVITGVNQTRTGRTQQSAPNGTPVDMFIFGW